MTRKEFNMACKKNGFIQKKQCFYRCIGEGILQTIRLNESRYIDPFSPYYSNIHRRSARIVLGLFSIYDALPEIWFDPRFGAGLIDARNLVSDRGLYFQGLQDHIDIMEKTGFRMLDGILTHHRMVQALETMSTVHPSLITGQNIVIPYLICGETEKAMPIIEKNYQTMLSNKDHLLAKDGDLRYLIEWEDLKKASLSEEVLHQYMKEHMVHNLSVAKQFGIILENQFEPLV